MYITYKTYDKIVSKVPGHPPEIGGILGGQNNVISCVIFDYGMRWQSPRKCHYTPDVEYLNKCIADWEERRIDFYGIFHTHFFGVDTLSEGDRQYMERIMQVMPNSKLELYFPIVVLPARKIVSYMCYRDGGKIRIVEDTTNLVKTI